LGEGLTEAQTVFDEVSRLLDRRLYRTRQLLWSFDYAADRRQQCLTDYRTIITEWNDNINRILAMLAIHFSIELRNVIDNQIGAQFRAIGRSLEQAIRNDPNRIQTTSQTSSMNWRAASTSSTSTYSTRFAIVERASMKTLNHWMQFT
jgi:hypothetical protein